MSQSASPPLTTPLTKLLGISAPVIAPPMAGASGGLLAAKATAGGGFGFIAAGYGAPSFLSEQINLARSTLTELGVSPGASQPLLPIGVGYLAWTLDKDPSTGRQLLDVALEQRVQAIWVSFGKNLQHWVEYARSRSLEFYGAEHRPLIFVLVNSVQEAQEIRRQVAPDVLVAQGNESGGHGSGDAQPLVTLLPAVKRALSDDDDTTPVLAAGGLTHGAHVAAMLALGAAGAVLGTRFLFTPESFYSPGQKATLLRATPGDAHATVRTTAFDELRGTVGWPDGVDGRALRNSSVQEAQGGGAATLEERRKRFAQAVSEGDPERVVTWAGTSVGLITEIKDAKEVMQELHRDTVSHLRQAAALISAEPL